MTVRFVARSRSCARSIRRCVRYAAGVRPLQVVPGGELQREHATRLAVNVAMYVLCSNYKDDQVHAPFLMRRRSSEPQ